MTLGLINHARARALSAFQFPGGGYSLEALGLDGAAERAGVTTVETPRHADLLLVAGPVPGKLREPLKRVYSQIPRPRYVISAGAGADLPVPPDAIVGLDEMEVQDAIRGLKDRIAAGYEGAPPLEDSGQDREEHGADHGRGDEGQEHEAHGEHEADGDHGHEEENGDHEGHGDHDSHTGHGGNGDDGHEAHESHEELHGGHDHGMMGEFVDGEDGLTLESLAAPFGPVHPAMPGGLGITLILDGDLVARAELERGYLARGFAGRVAGARPEAALDALRMLDPRTPVSVPLLYARAVESIAGAELPEAARFARIGLVELERASSHLLWLSGFIRVLGVEPPARRILDARRPLLAVLRAVRVTLGGLSGGLAGVYAEQTQKMLRGALRTLERGRLLPYRLEGLAVVEDAERAVGPAARAAGLQHDARTEDGDYTALDFEPVVEEGGDALARYVVRVREIEASLRLAEAALQRAAVKSADVGELPDGEAAVSLEGPRGLAKAVVRSTAGSVAGFGLEPPSKVNAAFLPGLLDGLSISDAAVALWSLDLSAEEMDA